MNYEPSEKGVGVDAMKRWSCSSFNTSNHHVVLGRAEPPALISSFKTQGWRHASRAEQRACKTLLH